MKTERGEKPMREGKSVATKSAVPKGMTKSATTKTTPKAVPKVAAKSAVAPKAVAKVPPRAAAVATKAPPVTSVAPKSAPAKLAAKKGKEIYSPLIPPPCALHFSRRQTLCNVGIQYLLALPPIK